MLITFKSNTNDELYKNCESFLTYIDEDKVNGTQNAKPRQ